MNKYIKCILLLFKRSVRLIKSLSHCQISQDQQGKLHTPVIREMSSGQTCCSNCFTTKSPLWRRSPLNKVLCNACGLYLRNHGSMRPLTLQTTDSKRLKDSEPTGSSDQSPLRSIKFSKTPYFSLVHHQRKGFGLSDQPKRVSSLPTWTLPVQSSPSTQTVSKKSVMYGGKYYNIGDGVVVYGDDAKHYFAVITNLLVDEYGTKFFNLKWLLPKADVNKISQERSLIPNDFLLGPDHRHAERMNCIVDVIFSQSSNLLHLLSTPPLTPVESPMKPEMHFGNIDEKLFYNGDDFEVAQLLISFNNSPSQ